MRPAPTSCPSASSPAEGVALDFSAKRPGMSLDLEPRRLSFDYAGAYGRPLPEAYERLIFDALRGDPTLFMRADELEAAWGFVTPILEAWATRGPKDLASYPAGSWGPSEADELAPGLRRRLATPMTGDL